MRRSGERRRVVRSAFWVVISSACFVVASGCQSWSPAFDAGANWYMNVCGSGGDDVYAVGGTPEAGKAMHFDGSKWSEVSLGVDVPLLNWCHAFSKSDVFVVGNGGTMLHFDGSAWTKLPALTTDAVWGVWGAAPDDVWAVGGSGFSNSRPQLFHYDGAAFSEAALPTLARQNVFALYKVWGTSRDNVLAVGQEGALVRFNGTEWKEEDAGAQEDLISLWGTGPDHIVAVGGRGNGIAAVWDGSAWTHKSLSPLPGINGVWTDSKDTAWIAGGTGTLGRLDLKTFEVKTEEVDTTLELHSVFGVGGHIYAVGGNLLTGASTKKYQGIALEK